MTTPKSTRLNEDEVRLLQLLLPHFPECRSEAHLIYQATMLGLWMLAVEAQRPGLVPFGGYTPADLAALLRPRILPALDFLVGQGQLPSFMTAAHGSLLVSAEPVPESPPPQIIKGDPLFDPEAASAMEDLGTDFLDD